MAQKKKLNLLIGDQEVILCQKQPSIAALYNLNKIWIRKIRVKESI